MKYLIVFAIFAAASASILPPAVIASTNPEVQEILASIQSPSTDPATAAALEQLLLEVLGIAKPEPIHVGPAIIDQYEPIHVGPAIVPFPVPDGGELTEVDAAPVMPAPSASAPLVQIILNINAAANLPGSPVVVETIPQPTPVQVVEEAEVPESVIVVDKPIVAEPVIVAPIVPEPILVADPVIVAPIVPEPVLVAPILPSPVVVLPDILN